MHNLVQKMSCGSSCDTRKQVSYTGKWHSLIYSNCQSFMSLQSAGVDVFTISVIARKDEPLLPLRLSAYIFHISSWRSTLKCKLLLPVLMKYCQ